MCEKKYNSITEYQLRKAAGKYFLLHMEQKGIPYEKPLLLNSVAAEFWSMLKEEKSKENIVKSIAEKYKVEEASVREDFESFYLQLKDFGIMIKE